MKHDGTHHISMFRNIQALLTSLQRSHYSHTSIRFV